MKQLPRAGLDLPEVFAKVGKAALWPLSTPILPHRYAADSDAQLRDPFHEPEHAMRRILFILAKVSSFSVYIKKIV